MLVKIEVPVPDDRELTAEDLEFVDSYVRACIANELARWRETDLRKLLHGEPTQSTPPVGLVNND